MNAGYLFTIMSPNSKGWQESKNGGDVKVQYEKQERKESEKAKTIMSGWIDGKDSAEKQYSDTA